MTYVTRCLLFHACGDDSDKQNLNVMSDLKKK